MTAGGTGPNFDRLAGVYRWMEWLSFGPHLGRCRRAFLLEMTESRRALVLGDGDGRFTAALLRQNKAIQVDAVDVSQALKSNPLVAIAHQQLPRNLERGRRLKSAGHNAASEPLRPQCLHTIRNRLWL